MKKSRVVLIAGFGTLFETFDFYLFALFSFALGVSLFGDVDHKGIVWVFLAFASGYVARIAGALFFGHIGDRFSRKLAFQYTIAVIGISSMLIGIIPPYSMIGGGAIALLFIFRVAQGFSYGGELAGAWVLVSEHSSKYRGFHCSLITLSGSLGIFAAIGTYTLIQHYFSPDQVAMFGWRIAFIGGGLIILHSYFARKSLLDSPVFLKKVKDWKEQVSINVVFKKHKLMLVYSLFLIVAAFTYNGVFVAYLPAYCQINCNQFQGDVSGLLMLLAICTVIGNPVGGILSQVMSYKKAYFILSLLGAITILPAYATISEQGYTREFAYYALGSCAFIHGCVGGICQRYLTENFPTMVRYTSVAIVLNVASMLFIGFSPLILTLLSGAIDSPLIPGMILLVAYVLQMVCVVLVEWRKKRDPVEIW